MSRNVILAVFVQLMLLSALFLQKYLSSEPNDLHQVLNRPLLLYN